MDWDVILCWWFLSFIPSIGRYLCAPLPWGWYCWSRLKWEVPGRQLVLQAFVVWKPEFFEGIGLGERKGGMRWNWVSRSWEEPAGSQRQVVGYVLPIKEPGFQAPRYLWSSKAAEMSAYWGIWGLEGTIMVWGLQYFSNINVFRNTWESW